MGNKNPGYMPRHCVVGGIYNLQDCYASIYSKALFQLEWNRFATLFGGILIPVCYGALRTILKIDEIQRLPPPTPHLIRKEGELYPLSCFMRGLVLPLPLAPLLF
jgi:hypothetical protein